MTEAATGGARVKLRVGLRDHEGWLYGVAVAVLLLNLFDASLTMLWVHAGLATEANPLMDVLLVWGPVPFVLAKLGLVSLGVLLLWRLRHRHGAVIGLFVAFIAYYAITVQHLWQVGFLLSAR